MKSADPLIPLADLRNEEIQQTVVTNPYWERMSANDIDGDDDDVSYVASAPDVPVCSTIKTHHRRDFPRLTKLCEQHSNHQSERE